MTNMVNLTIPNITVSETTPMIPTNRATIAEAERKEETTTQEKSRLTHHKHGKRNADIVMAKRRAHTREEVLQDGLHK